MISVAAACTAIQLTAMPSYSELQEAEPQIKKLVEPEYAALESDKKPVGEVADSVFAKAQKAKNQAEKLLLLKGAFMLYVRNGDKENALKMLTALQQLVAASKPDGYYETIIGHYTWKYNVKNDEADIVSVKAEEGADGTIVVPEKIDGVKVTGLAGSSGDALKWSGAKSVKIPAGVTKIGWSPCAECVNLLAFFVDPANPAYCAKNGQLCTKDGKYLLCGVNGNVTIPKGVKDIGRGAFCGFGGVKSVKIPEGVTTIGYCAMCQCGFSELTLPSSLRIIYHGAFWGCGNLTKLTIKEGVTDIQGDAFWRCGGLKTVTMPASVTNLLGNTFRDCGNLESVTMLGERPTGPENIFQGCAKLKEIHVPASAKSWADMKSWCGKPLVFDKR